ncbi:CAP domain-containing protein [Streptomyces sp. NPDC004327]|uniref:CAP domain-containing protein n=1 Tax=Streptomyces sp. NPDC004327 TaxID=3364699 RepID=UPI00368F46C3
MRHDAHDPDATPDDTSPARRRAGRGRHRRRAVLRGLPFRTAVTTTGTLAAALTVAAGVYVMTLGAPADAGAAPAPPRPAAPGMPAMPAMPGKPGAPFVRPVAAWVSAPDTAAAGTVAKYASRVVSLVNTARERAGCEPLRADPELRKAAQAYADEMAGHDYYAHDTPDGRNGGDRITAAHYAWETWGENIHRGPHTPDEVVDDWMNSEGHRKNILDCAFRDVGVGVNLSGDGPWWVQDFATPRADGR